MDQPRKVAKPARGQLNREIKCPCRRIRGKYIYSICTAVCFCLYTRYVFYLETCAFVHGSVHCCIYVYTCMCYYSGMCVCIFIKLQLRGTM